MTYEQYGTGEFGVSIHHDDFSGQYRFATAEEARAFQRRNGGRLFRSRRPMSPIHEIAAACDRADMGPMRPNHLP